MNILEYIQAKDFPKEAIRFEKGQTIAIEGDRCEGLYIISDGMVEIVSYALSGKQIVYNQLGEGEMFGNHLVFSSDPVYKGNVQAKTDCELIYISKETLLEILQEDKEFLIYYLKLNSDFGKELNAKMKILSFDSAEERLLFYLEKHDGMIIMKSIASLADTLFLQRETLSRLIHRMENEGRLILNGKTITMKK